jgi:hypothetical protein
MINQNILERNKANFIKAKGAFNENRINDCILFYAPNHTIKSKKSESSRDGIKVFLETLRLAWPDVQIVVEQVVAVRQLLHIQKLFWA